MKSFTQASKPLVIGAMVLFVAGCGSQVDEPELKDFVENGQFFGFSTQDGADVNGDFSGIPSSAAIVVRDPARSANGYSYAATRVADISAVGQTRSTNATPGFIAISSILPGTDVGTPPTSGSATFNGTYNLSYAPVTSGDVEQAQGLVQISADFGAQNVTATTVNQTGQKLTMADTGLSLGGGSDALLLNTTYRGVTGLANGKVGPNGAVAAIGGGSISGPAAVGVYSGGFIAK